MSKLALTSLGAASIAASVPVMHMLGRRVVGGARTAVMATTTAAFVAGWGMLAAGLAQPPAGTQDEVTAAWKRRQVGLSVAGAVLVVMGVGAVRYGSRMRVPTPVGSALFIAGWATLTAAMVLADPDYSTMGSHEKAGRVTHALAATLTVILGAALISMSDNRVAVAAQPTSTVPLTQKTLDIAAVAAFVVGWGNVVSVTALQ